MVTFTTIILEEESLCFEFLMEQWIRFDQKCFTALKILKLQSANLITWLIITYFYQFTRLFFKLIHIGALFKSERKKVEEIKIGAILDLFITFFSFFFSMLYKSFTSGFKKSNDSELDQDQNILIETSLI